MRKLIKVNDVKKTAKTVRAPLYDYLEEKGLFSWSFQKGQDSLCYKLHSHPSSIKLLFRHSFLNSQEDIDENKIETLYRHCFAPSALVLNERIPVVLIRSIFSFLNPLDWSGSQVCKMWHRERQNLASYGYVTVIPKARPRTIPFLAIANHAVIFTDNKDENLVGSRWELLSMCGPKLQRLDINFLEELYTFVGVQFTSSLESLCFSISNYHSVYWNPTLMVFKHFPNLHRLEITLNDYQTSHLWANIDFALNEIGFC